MKTHQLFSLFVVVPFILAGCHDNLEIDLADYGLKPDTKENASALLSTAITAIQQQCGDRTTIHIKLPKGRYDFHPEGSSLREYFISNHDQDNPKAVGLAFEDMKNIIFDGQGSELVFHGVMLPVSILRSEGCTLKNFSIDFENPHISQVKVLENDTVNKQITYEVAPWVKYEIRDDAFVAYGEGWKNQPSYGIAFEGKTKRLVYTTSDIAIGTTKVKEIGPRKIVAPWDNKKLIPGTVVVFRAPGRPTPGFFLYKNRNTTLENIQVHYAEGMGLLAQLDENITLDHFSVCLKGKEDPRYFTTQADATHFSGCKGKIISKGGLYEGMMDDAINVHGTYLKVRERIDDNTLIGEYMHSQSYGFDWGTVGDEVQFVQSKTMELIEEKNTITRIETVDQPTSHGAKKFKITFKNAVPAAVSGEGAYGIENLTWTPEVYFAENTIRNNRARGSLFSTPRTTVVEKNLFDHTSGTAILLCGDCNGWFETGSCHDVVIRDNHFINSLTNMFQFTNGVISIYPEIPDLKSQKKYFHSNIRIENNRFETFDRPILYAKSVDGLVFNNNTITQNQDFPAFHWNKYRFFFQRVRNYTLEGNTFSDGYDEAKDLKVED